MIINTERNSSKAINIKVLLTTFIITIIYIVFCLLTFQETLIPLLNNGANWLGIFVYVYAIYTWKIISNDKWFSPYSIFYTFFTIFNFGQPIMWAFGIHRDYEIGLGEIYYGSGIFINDSQLLSAKLYIIACMLIFTFGAMLSNKFSKNNTIIPINQDKYTFDSIYIIGKVLGIIAIPSTLYRSFTFYYAAKTYGYNALYYSSNVNQGGILMILEMFFFPALICLLIGSKYRNSIRSIVYIVFCIYLALNVLSGDRGSWLYKLLILVWLSSVYYKPLNGKKILLLGVFSVVGLYFLNAIISVRDNGLNDFDLVNIFESRNSPIVDVFFEMGGSMGILAYLLIAGNSIWPFGNTYMMALTGMVSSKLSMSLGSPFVLVDNWFSQEYLGLDWGVGFSMIGEAYLNGGMFGGLGYIFFIGLGIAKAIGINEKHYPYTSPLKYFVVATSLNTLIGYSRGSIYLYLKTLFYGTIFVYFAIVLIRDVLKKNKSL